MLGSKGQDSFLNLSFLVVFISICIIAMLYLECAYRYADMMTLMCLIAIEMTDDMQLAINDFHLFTLC